MLEILGLQNIFLHLFFLNFLQDYTVHELSCKLIYLKCFLRREHSFLRRLFIYEKLFYCLCHFSRINTTSENVLHQNFIIFELHKSWGPSTAKVALPNIFDRYSWTRSRYLWCPSVLLYTFNCFLNSNFLCIFDLVSFLIPLFNLNKLLICYECNLFHNWVCLVHVILVVTEFREYFRSNHA